MTIYPFTIDFCGMAENLPMYASALFIGSFLIFRSFLRNRHTLRIMKCLLSAAVMIPAAFIPASAQTDSGPMLGIGSINNPGEGCLDNLEYGICDNSQWAGSYVYFGTYDGKPMKYRVLNTFEESFTSQELPTMLLDCDNVVNTDLIFGRNYDARWDGSQAQYFLQDSFFNALTSNEQKAVAVSRKLSPSGNDGFGSEALDWVRLKGDTIFLLDAKEVTRKSYGYRWGNLPDDDQEKDDGERIKKNLNGDDGMWYLRSIGHGAVPDEGDNPMTDDPTHKDEATPDKYVGYVSSLGSIASARQDSYYEPQPKGISPALNVKTGSVIFSHLISGTAGEEDAEYKLTLPTDDITVTITGDIEIDYPKVRVPYQVTGNFTRVYGIAADHEYTESAGWLKKINDFKWTNGQVLSQTESNASSGKMEFTLSDNPGLTSYIMNWDREFYLYLIAEKENDGTLTNYASIPLKVVRPEHEHNWVYEVSGNKITARCEAPLHPNGNTDELYINAPSNETGKPEYDGTAKEAYLTTSGKNGQFSDVDQYTIQYYQCAESSDSSTEDDQCENPVDMGKNLPVNAGKYKAAVTVYGTTAEVTYRIYLKTAAIQIKDQTIYTGGHIKNGPEWADLSLVLPGHKLSAISLYTDETYIKAVTEETKIVDEDSNDDVTANYLIMHHNGNLTILEGKTYQVTFKVENGRWDDGSSDDKSDEVSGPDDTDLKLTDKRIPAVGSNPNEHYRAGSWDKTPDTETIITKDTVFTYTYKALQSIEVTADDVSVTYDAAPHSISLSVKDAGSGGELSGYTVVYGDTEGTYNLSENPEYTDAGEYRVFYQVSAENYETAAGSAKITISKADLTVTANDQEYTWNGQTQGEGDTAYEDPAEIAEKVTVTGLKGSDVLTSIILDGQGTDVGEYPIEISGFSLGEDSENYNISCVPGKLTIKMAQKPLAVTQQSVAAGHALPAPQYTKPDGTLTETISYSGKLSDGSSYGPTDNAPTAAGTYKVTVSCETKNINYTGTAEFEITPGRPFYPVCEDCELPPTGFSPIHSTVLPEQPNDLNYKPMGMRLMIPSLNVDSELVTVPLSGKSWAVEWLGAKSGILEGSALPGEGLSVIAAHNTLNDTEFGPFALLNTMEVNDLVAVVGRRNELRTFRVYANELLAPNETETVAAIASREANSLVLITCENESAAGGYLNRRIIFAKPDQQ